MSSFYLNTDRRYIFDVVCNETMLFVHLYNEDLIIYSDTIFHHLVNCGLMIDIEKTNWRICVGNSNIITL